MIRVSEAVQKGYVPIIYIFVKLFKQVIGTSFYELVSQSIVNSIY
jgi:hypothetical protein